MTQQQRRPIQEMLAMVNTDELAGWVYKLRDVLDDIHIYIDENKLLHQVLNNVVLFSDETMEDARKITAKDMLLVIVDKIVRIEGEDNEGN